MADVHHEQRKLDDIRRTMQNKADDVVHWATQIKNSEGGGLKSNFLTLANRVKDLDHLISQVTRQETELEIAKGKEFQSKLDSLRNKE
jgi:hypothetical protein